MFETSKKNRLIFYNYFSKFDIFLKFFNRVRSGWPCRLGSSTVLIKSTEVWENQFRHHTLNSTKQRMQPSDGKSRRARWRQFENFFFLSRNNSKKILIVPL